MILTKRSTILTIMLAFLLIVYTAGLLNSLLVLTGGQELDPEIWQLNSLPAYVIVFALGDVSALVALRWKKLGLQGLFMTVVFSGILYTLFGPPFPTNGVTFPIILASSVGLLILLAALNRKYFFTIF